MIPLNDFRKTKKLFKIKDEEIPKNAAIKFERPTEKIDSISTKINKKLKCISVEIMPLITNLNFVTFSLLVIICFI